MAAHSLSSSEYNSAGSGQWKRKKRCRYHGDGAGMVWFHLVDYSYDWVAGYDFEHQAVHGFDG